MDTESFFSEPVVQSIDTDWVSGSAVTLSVLRLDVIHPQISGNKWYKLKENIRLASDKHKTTLLTFGGRWSNHLLATAAAAKAFGFHSLGIIAGFDNKEAELTETLKSCKRFGMELSGISREAYRQRYNAAFLEDLQNKHTDSLIIPEGGNNDQGRAGAGAIANWIPSDITHIALPVGTGTTFSGIRNAIPQTAKMIGFAPFRKIDEQVENIQNYCPEIQKECWEIFSDDVWKGFGKYDGNLISFANDFYQQFEIPLDIVYTAKMMYYLKEKIQSHLFPSGSRVLAIHTGGLQGNFSVKNLLRY